MRIKGSEWRGFGRDRSRILLAQSIVSAARARSDFLLAPTSLYYFAFLIVPSIAFCVVSFYGKSDNGFYDGIFTRGTISAS